MELSKNYIPAEVEAKWTKHWLAKKYFNSKPDDRKPFTVVIPPPNVTGVLHMGHTLNETVQDILVRKARMSGYNACWVPGSDHASIATEAKVVQMLKEKGIDKNSLSREEFLKYAFEWKEKYGGIIYNQIERLGCSVDWDRVTFTMDDHYYKAVIKVFIDLYNKGLIYRGARMINWDPAAKTALSDEEVEYKDIQGKLYHIKYKAAASDDYIVIATQRPETIMGDTAVCVNPNDERYKHLKGAKVVVPLINRAIPIIFDEYVDPTFGTGALKVTPAHDINDYNLGLKHNLEVVDTLNEDGTLSEAAQIYVGVDRFKARKQIVAELQEKGFLLKEEEYSTRLGYSQRTGVVVEPRISTQWFLKMKEMAEPALKAVVDGDICIHPGDKFLATYKYWLENVKDWCISRQLWWGQQIPAWYDEIGNFVVAENEYEALHQFQAKFGTITASTGKLAQDPDVLDTWFSSWLWPSEVFHGISNPGNKEIKYYYPTSVLVTGQDIIFFWVARMVMAGMEYEKQIPFRDVYFTGMVRDKQGRKMSKSLGNSPDLLELIDKYGADAVRFGIMISSPAGNDLLFDEASLEQGSHFINKMWNALKLVKGIWKVAEKENLSSGFYDEGETPEIDHSISQPDYCRFATNWFKNRLNQAQTELNSLYQDFKLSEALKYIYSLIWDDFCASYLEWVKPEYGQSIDYETQTNTTDFFESLMQMLHPFMPFVTEEIYHILRERNDDLCVKQSKISEPFDIQILQAGLRLKSDIATFREMRAKYKIKNSERIDFFGNSSTQQFYNINEGIRLVLQRQINGINTDIHEMNAIKTGQMETLIKNEVLVVSSESKFFVHLNNKIDTSSQKAQLLKDLEYYKGFLQSVEKKLGNEKFVQNAKPEVVELEKKKKADAEEKIRVIEESLK